MNYNQLKQVFETEQKAIQQATREFTWADPSCYARWLANTLFYVQNSTRILALAAGTFDLTKTALSNRFIAHAAEEKGHERLLIMDMKALGVESAKLPISKEMHFYYYSLYYWLAPAAKPVGLLGWILSLEGVAAGVGPEIYDLVCEKHGPAVAQFLKVHAEADQHHVVEALNITQGLTVAELALVAKSIQLYSRQYCSILQDIQRIKGEVLYTDDLQQAA